MNDTLSVDDVRRSGTASQGMRSVEEAPAMPTASDAHFIATPPRRSARDAEIWRRAEALVTQDPTAPSNLMARSPFARQGRISAQRELDIEARFVDAEAALQQEESQRAWLRQRDDERAAMVRRILKRSGDFRHVVSILNSKGGSGKTPLTVNLAIVLYVLIKEQILLVDANENDGTTAQRVGVDRTKTMSIRNAVAHPELLCNFDAIVAGLRKPDDYNVRVMTSDPGGHAGISLDGFMDVLHTLKLYGGHTMFCDTGNGNGREPNLGSALVSDTLLFSALAYNTETFEQLLSTMHAYTELGLRDKVQRAFIVVSGAQEGQTSSSFYSQLLATRVVVKNANGDSDDLRLSDFKIDSERILVIPYDQYIAERRVANHQMLNPETFWAYVRVLDAIFDQKDVHYIPPTPPQESSSGASVGTPTYQPSNVG